MTFYLKTHIGLVRKSNQDNSFAIEQNGCLFAVVADGMGGHSGGETASQIVIDTSKKYLQDVPADRFNLQIIRNLLVECNKNVWEHAQRHDKLKGMGSTATLIVIKENEALVGHVGDSRAYLYRGGQLAQLTKDHSYVQMLIEKGRITMEEALRHPHRNIITRAIGAESRVEADVFSAALEAGDVLLLCSDGLNTAITDEQIARILLLGVPEAAERLIEAALESGGTDNITVLIAETDGGRQ